MPRSFAHLKAIRLERRVAALRRRELSQLPRDVHARHGFDPNQPRVPAGHADGGQWTSGGGGGDDRRIISDVTPDNDWIPGAQYASGPRRGPVVVRIGRQWVKVEGGQAARLVEAQTRAEAATARVRSLDPNWRPRPSVYESVEGLIRTYESEAQEAQARIRELERFEIPQTVPKNLPRRAGELRRDDYLIEVYRDEPKTLEELQRAVSRPKRGYDIHHIVEQTSAEQDGFPRSVIDAPNNLVRIPRLKHWEITGWYMTKNKAYGGPSPRAYLRGKGWDDRTSVGLDALAKFGVLKP
jgi:hypothetical protein